MAITKVTSGLISADASSIDLNIDAGTLYLDVSENRVGIGTTSPSKPLDVQSGTANSNIAHFTGSNSTRGMTIATYNADSFDDAGVDLYGLRELRFSTNVAEAMRIDSSGNVGIGTSSPSSFNQRVNAPHLVVGSGSNSSGLTVYSGSSNQGSINFADGTTTTQQYEGGLVYSHASNYMSFHTNGGTEAMRIDSSGNVGIGVVPSAFLLPNGSTGALQLQSGGLLSAYNTNTYLSQNWYYNAGEKYIANGSASRYAQTGAEHVWSSAGNNTSGAGAGLTWSEAMRIDASGNLLVGTTGTPTTGGFKFDAGSDSLLRIGHASNVATGSNYLLFYHGSNVIGSITQNGTSAVAYNTSSDYRLKENVDYDFTALDRVAQLKPARFNFIEDADNTVDGFLAHEVQDIVPEAVAGEKDAVDDEGNPEYQGIDQSKLVPLLTKAIQEQQTIIDNLKTRIETLESA